MNAQPLFDLKPYNPTNWRDKVKSASFDERQIIQWIMRLYLDGQGFDADVTYSTGHFWYDLPQPRFKFDLKPQVEDVIAADARRLPIASGSLRSIMFDPPFTVGGGIPGKIKKRFAFIRDKSELFHFYTCALSELSRILVEGGTAVIKCQDVITGGRQVWSHMHLMNEAEKFGLAAIDLFVLIASSFIWSPNMAKQQHARKIHSYFLVFRKP